MRSKPINEKFHKRRKNLGTLALNFRREQIRLFYESELSSKVGGLHCLLAPGQNPNCYNTYLDGFFSELPSVVSGFVIQSKHVPSLIMPFLLPPARPIPMNGQLPPKLDVHVSRISSRHSFRVLFDCMHVTILLCISAIDLWRSIIRSLSKGNGGDFAGVPPNVAEGIHIVSKVNQRINLSLFIRIDIINPPSFKKNLLFLIHCFHQQYLCRVNDVPLPTERSH